MKKEVYFIVLGFLILLFTYICISLPSYECMLYDIQTLEFINKNRIHILDNLWKLITNTSWLVCLLISIFPYVVAKTKKLPGLKVKSYLLLMCWVTVSLLSNGLKYLIGRVRPFVLYDYIEKLTGGESPSFPSGHTSEAFAMAGAVFLLFSSQKRFKILVFLWAFMVAYSRMSLGVHFPSDVLAGIGLGFFSSGLVLYCNAMFYTKIKAD